MTIDFKVLDSKEYTFFIDDELCKIRLERRGEKMYYFFEVDKKVDTPLNRARWAREKKHLRQLLITLGVGGVLIAAISLWVSGKPKGAELVHELSKKGVETVGRLVSEPQYNGGNVYFQFIAGTQREEGQFNLDAPGGLISQNKFPLMAGDEFTVRYVPGNPSLNRIYLNRPTAAQIQTYRKRALKKHLELNPNLAPKTAECLLDIAFEMDGLEGLAHFYFQKTPPADNPSFNSDSFQKFYNSYLFKGKAKSQCKVE